MGRICRFKPDQITHLAFKEAYPTAEALAQQAGLPIEQVRPMLQQIVFNTLHAAFAGLQQKFGVFSGIGDDSPYFQQFGAMLLNPAGQQVVAHGPVVPPGTTGVPAMRPAVPQTPPMAIPQAPMAAPAMAPMFTPQAGGIPPIAHHAAPQPLPPGAVLPGQPLPPIMTPAARTPPPMPPQFAPAGPGSGGITAHAPHAVPMNAPVHTGEPPSMTNAPAPMPSMLDE